MGKNEEIFMTNERAADIMRNEMACQDTGILKDAYKTAIDALESANGQEVRVISDFNYRMLLKDSLRLEIAKEYVAGMTYLDRSEIMLILGMKNQYPATTLDEKEGEK